MPKKPACDSCHRKKITCDRARPRCEWCQHRDLPCSFDRLKDKSAAINASHVSRIRTSKRKAACQVRDSNRGDSAKQDSAPPALPSAPGDATVSRPLPPGDHAAAADEGNDCIFYGGLQFAGADLGQLSSRCGLPVFPAGGRRWIQNQTGVTDIFPKVYDTPRDEPKMFQSEPSSPLFKFEVAVPRQNLGVWVEAFLTSPLSLVFPVISRETISQTLRTAYATGESTTSSVVGARACALSFMAMLFKLDPDFTPDFSIEDASLYVTAVEQGLLSTLAIPTLDGLQACLMLVLYYQVSGSLESATMFHLLACRCVVALGGHQSQCEEDSTCESRHCRRLFWLCYFIDKDITLRTGQAPIFSDAEVDLGLPHNYNFYSLPLDGSEVSSQQPLYFSDLRLTRIKSKICTSLWSKAAAAKTNGQLIADITSMDAELEGWRLSVPELFRPHLSVVSDAIKGPMHHSAKMLVIFSHLEYFFLLAAVHRASGQRRKWRTGGTIELGALKSSMQVTIEASRSTLQLLKAGLWDLQKELFWLFSFYPMWSAMTLFCYILYDPTSPNVQADLGLLKLVPRLMRSLPASGLDASQEAHLKSLNAFLDELPRLSNLAVAKAKKSRIES